MHRCTALILIIMAPAFGQLKRGTARVSYSGLHNHWAIPLDGGQITAWGMAGNSDCVNNPIPNDATFTGSAASSLQCGGVTAPSVSSQGLSIAGPCTGTGCFASASTNPSFPNAWSLTSVFLPTSTTGEQACSVQNFNYPTASTFQYFMEISVASTGAVATAYVNSVNNTFTSSTTPISSSNWQVVSSRYKSTVGSSGQLWYNNAKIAGTWTLGSGSTALPAVQGETDVGGRHGFALSCIGTIGLIVMHDHDISDSAHGFIYYASKRLMMERSVNIP